MIGVAWIEADRGERRIAETLSKGDSRFPPEVTPDVTVACYHNDYWQKRPMPSTDLASRLAGMRRVEGYGGIGESGGGDSEEPGGTLPWVLRRGQLLCKRCRPSGSNA